MLLNSGTAYEILLACETDFVLEVMRAARGKSALEPIELAQNSYSKVIVRKGDVHWYHFTPVFPAFAPFPPSQGTTATWL